MGWGVCVQSAESTDLIQPEAESHSSAEELEVRFGHYKSASATDLKDWVGKPDKVIMY